VLLGDAIAERVGGYVLGNVLVSLVAGLSSLAVLLALGVPYPFLLATVVAVLDLIPVAGSVTAGIIASLVAFTVSPAVGWAVVGFFVLYRFLEDYLIFPAIVGRVVRVPALLTLVAVLLGGALYGIVGVLIAIPVAATVHLLIHEIVFPRLDSVSDPAP
jgi:predicted PurR-regulated permease PerM